MEKKYQNMKKEQVLVNKNKLSNHQINMEVMQFPNYYRSLAKTMLLRGESLDAVQKEIDKYSHMY
jgi:hypothetical protein